MGSQSRPGAFEQHLREAIELNRIRAPLYIALSNGASSSLSRSLIIQERLMLPLARWFDRRAERYHDAGVPLLDDAFVSMSLTPEFREFREPIPATPRLEPRPRAIGRAVRQVFGSSDFPAAAARIEIELEALAGEPSYHCMLRHLLESALRIAVLAPLHDQLARRLSLPRTRSISAGLLRLHLLGLSSAARLDRRARPLQERGIAIIAQDVPSISPLPATLEQSES